MKFIDNLLYRPVMSFCGRKFRQLEKQPTVACLRFVWLSNDRKQWVETFREIIFVCFGFVDFTTFHKNLYLR